MPTDPIVYDKAKYHMETVESFGLDEDQAFVHTAFYLRWILENKLYSEEFQKETQGPLEQFETGKLTALDIYQWWDGCLVDDMLNEEGNAFSQTYFNFEKGRYLKDYRLLEKGYPSTYHVPFTDENYAKLKPLIDTAYQSWKTPKPWWKF